MRNLSYYSLLKNLNSLCKFLDDTYDVNSGGCCFLASLIAKHLDKLNIKYNLVVYDCCTKNRLCIEQEVISCHKNKGFRNSITGRYSCNHYCLQLKGAGVINSDNYKGDHQYLIPNISYKNIKWIYKNSNWNDCYDVQYNKTIKNIVKEFFEKYEKISIF